MQPKKASLTTLSNEALCKLRDEIAALLNSRAEDLRRELDRLTGGAVADGGGLRKAAASTWELFSVYYGSDWQRAGPSHCAGRLPVHGVATGNILLGKSYHQTVLRH
jgi:hypothetical protein